MLSVLIPVYNFDIRLLVNTLHEQLTLNKILFEIICLDDCSKPIFADNNAEIQKLSHTSYKISDTNTGRIATRQALAEYAKYDWLLFLDADVFPKTDDFITNYIPFLTLDYDAVYGGFSYNSDAPAHELLLRWTYGKAKEQVAAEKRNKKPYKVVISANFLIKTSVFKSINGQITQKGYGYDNYFGALLKIQNNKIVHIDNEVYHLGLESSSNYLNKVEQSVQTLLQLEKLGALSDSENSLLQTFRTIKRLKLERIGSWCFKTFGNRFKQNLLGHQPKVWVLQCYKLSYICYQDLNS
ncbi:Glycosyl transferase family 2 [Formosa sp. Hel1_31_208]|uniref:glycosyltransferase family 2 protein n=1 Tax=Formosa sp. Hel1_31_208 TaxID=1798225 RepID=UPI00087CA771|nr:glycosyltransferase family 2 protein [Formosa sp. Hel1_31_208]SDS03395.1 Glycosyl transferase family 2 [Formosa sp. Hel1_31_208]